MSYQIPYEVSILQLRSLGKVPLSQFIPTDDVKIKNVIITMLLRGLISSDFQMKLNVYHDDQGRSLLLSSKVVNNFDIVRVGDFYCEQRFDFLGIQNLLTIGHKYYIEFEIFGTYAMDENNYVGLIIDFDSPLAIISGVENVIRHSCFYEKA